MEAQENKISIYKHKDKNVGSSGYSHDGSYQKLFDIRMKSPESGKWYDGVIYQNIYTLEMYAREKEDFYNKFEDVSSNIIACIKGDDQQPMAINGNI